MPPGALAQVLGERQKTPSPDLLVGFEGAEDAGVLRIAPDRALVFTTDFFPPMVDDPFTFGRIAAANALSDVYAMGGLPLGALNLAGFPPKLDLEILAEIFAGGADKVREAGAVIAGGHTVEDAEIKYGLAVTGSVHPERIVRNHGIREGDALILTKPLGTGLITSSIKASGNEGPEVAEAIRWMTTLNGTGLDAILEVAPHAMTDVTGFGFIGHLAEMLATDPVEVTISSGAVPRIIGVERCFLRKCRTRASQPNRDYAGERLQIDSGLGEWDLELLLDPQTSGGLLIALPESDAPALVERLRGVGLERATLVGTVRASPEARLRIVA